MSQATNQAIAKSVQINRHAVGGQSTRGIIVGSHRHDCLPPCRWSAAVGPRRDRRPGGGAVPVNLAADLRGVATGLTSITLPNMCRWTEVASAAASLAGVKLNGATELTADEDPTAYVISANIHRRHSTKGQRAMAYARIVPEADNKGGRGKKNLTTELGGFSTEYVRKARSVLKYSTDGDLADDVRVAAKTHWRS